MHQHPCDWTLAGCTNTVECGADLLRNHDGIPDVICAALVDGKHFECEPCATGRCPECRCIVRLEGHDEDCALVLAGDICKFCLKVECVKGPYGTPYGSCADCAGDDPRVGA